MDFTEIMIALAIISVILILFYFYIKAMVAVTIKTARKQISKGKLSDKNLIKSYKNYADSKLFFYFLLGGPIYYHHMKKASPIIRDIYYQEMVRRNLPV